LVIVPDTLVEVSGICMMRGASRDEGGKLLRLRIKKAERPQCWKKPHEATFTFYLSIRPKFPVTHTNTKFQESISGECLFCMLTHGRRDMMRLDADLLMGLQYFVSPGLVCLLQDTEISPFTAVCCLKWLKLLVQRVQVF